MNKRKGNKGITLIALIITIIVLLILAGVVINMTLGNDGIIAKAQGTADSYKNAQEKEETQIAKYTNQIVNYIEGDRNNFTIGDCTIDLSRNMQITVSGVNNIKGFITILNNKYNSFTEGSTLQLTIGTNKEISVYVIAVDEEGNLYKSNTVSKSIPATVLYDVTYTSNILDAGFSKTAFRPTGCGGSAVQPRVNGNVISNTGNDQGSLYYGELINTSIYSGIKVECSASDSGYPAGFYLTTQYNDLFSYAQALYPYTNEGGSFSGTYTGYFNVPDGQYYFVLFSNARSTITVTKIELF